MSAPVSNDENLPGAMAIVLQVVLATSLLAAVIAVMVIVMLA